MAYKFQAGQKILVELNSGDVIEGEYIKSSNTRISLKNCYNTMTKTHDLSVQHFYESEIENIKAFDVEESSDSVSTDSQSVNAKTTTAECKLIKMPEQKYQELKELSKHYIYMATKDARYHEAVDDLSGSETIGLAMLSSDIGRNALIQLLVCSTWEQIYIFDLSLYNNSKLPTALKFILTSPDIVKVVHDSREIVDCLYHQYKIKLANIFDTYVAAQMVSEENLTLAECLSYYFNFPTVIIKEATSVELKSVWSERPLEDMMKEYAAMNVQYLITLKNYLQGLLLKDFHAKVHKHSQSTLELSALDAQRSLGCLDLNKV